MGHHALNKPGFGLSHETPNRYTSTIVKTYLFYIDCEASFLIIFIKLDVCFFWRLKQYSRRLCGKIQKSGTAHHWTRTRAFGTRGRRSMYYLIPRVQYVSMVKRINLHGDHIQYITDICSYLFTNRGPDK